MDASLIRWQKGMSALFKDIVDTTPAGEISDSSLEFKFDADSRKYMRSAHFHTSGSVTQTYLGACDMTSGHYML